MNRFYQIYKRILVFEIRGLVFTEDSSGPEVQTVEFTSSGTDAKKENIFWIFFGVEFQYSVCTRLQGSEKVS